MAPSPGQPLSLQRAVGMTIAAAAQLYMVERATELEMAVEPAALEAHADEFAELSRAMFIHHRDVHFDPDNSNEYVDRLLEIIESEFRS